jgi:hypothetical protein
VSRCYSVMLDINPRENTAHTSAYLYAMEHGHYVCTAADEFFFPGATKRSNRERRPREISDASGDKMTSDVSSTDLEAGERKRQRRRRIREQCPAQSLLPTWMHKIQKRLRPRSVRDSLALRLKFFSESNPALQAARLDCRRCDLECCDPEERDRIGLLNTRP